MNTRTSSYSNTRKMVLLALFAAIAFAVMYIGRIPMVLFLKYDPKDVIIAIAGFIYGPLSALAISVVVSLVEMVTVSDTGFIGLIMNVLSTCAFVCPAAYIYKKNRTVKGAVIGLATGVALMTVVMLLWNYLITPIYMGVPREQIVGMLVPAFLPFNLIKATLNAALTMLLYKPLVTALRRSHMLPPEVDAQPATKKLNLSVVLIALLVIASCVLVVLALNGII